MNETFDTYGVCRCRIYMDNKRGTPNGVGLVEYSTVGEMKAALGRF